MQVKIKDIKIGRRLRENDGDMQGLADSIEAFGLLHPIVIDQDSNLVAGCRRLLACERLGWKEIEVKKLENLSEKELREIELEENIKRKDLTPIENSRHLIELAGLKEAKVQKNELRTESVRKGRPVEGGSIREVAKEIGISPMTLHDAQKHVKAVEKYPDLEQVPKYKAIAEAKERDGVINLAQEKVRRAEAENVQIDKDSAVHSKYKKACNGVLMLDQILADENAKEAICRIVTIIPDGLESEIEYLDYRIRLMNKLKNYFLREKAKGGVNGKK